MNSPGGIATISNFRPPPRSSVKAYALFVSLLFSFPLSSRITETKSKLCSGKGGFSGIAASDELGFVELLVASKACNLFFASATNFPLGYCCKYALKASGSVLVLIESQKAISSAEALPDGEAFVRLVRAGGVVFLDGGVAFFARSEEHT